MAASDMGVLDVVSHESQAVLPESGIVDGGIGSECDAWLYGRVPSQRDAGAGRAFWSTEEVEAYFIRRRQETLG